MATTSRQIWFGKSAEVPREVAVCPECTGTLEADCQSWDSETGQPIAYAIEVTCSNDPCCEHRCNAHEYRQCDWQPVRDAVNAWAEAIND